MGININSHRLEYREVNDFFESNYSTNSTLNSFRLNNSHFIYGEGLSFQMGAIAKMSQQFRLGLSYESPTYFNISEETTQFVASNDGTNITVEPNVINVFPDYRFKTPSKYTGSLAYIFGKKGLVSLDYTQVNYDKANLMSPMMLF